MNITKIAKTTTLTILAIAVVGLIVSSPLSQTLHWPKAKGTTTQFPALKFYQFQEKYD
jgi:hypothetical protein